MTCSFSWLVGNRRVSRDSATCGRPGLTRGAWAGTPRQRRSTSPTVSRFIVQKRHCEEQSDAAIYEIRAVRSRRKARVRTHGAWAGTPRQRRGTSPTVSRFIVQRRHCEPPTPTAWAPTGSKPTLLSPYPRRTLRHLRSMILTMGIFLLPTACVPKRSRATRQSMRSGPFDHVGGPGRVLSGRGTISGKPGSRRLLRRLVTSVPVLGCFERFTRLATTSLNLVNHSSQ